MARLRQHQNLWLFNRIGWPHSQLLLQKTAIFLRSADPATGLHAVRVSRAAICDAGRDRRSVRVFGAGRDAGFLLAAATHRRRNGGAGAEYDNHCHAGKRRCPGQAVRIGFWRHAAVLGGQAPRRKPSCARSLAPFVLG